MEDPKIMMNLFSRTISTAAAATTVGLLIVSGMVLTSQRAHADSKADTKAEDLAQIGLRIAPVKLTYKPQNRELVGLGSFIVNAQAGCNGCHGSDPTKEYAPGGNPFFNQHPAVVNPDTYLAGGRDFGPVGGGIVNGVTGPGPHIISRNLTPDKTGLPAGGITFADFLAIMRNGTDFDHAHLNCSQSVTDNCYFPPADGALLQIMPWPAFSNMTDRQLLAIWTYLSAIPCIDNTTSVGPAGSPDLLRNDCGN
jgi:hypothetical protein